MGMIIAKSVLSTIDVLIAACVVYGTKDIDNRQVMRTGAVIFTALNIAAMWL